MGTRDAAAEAVVRLRVRGRNIDDLRRANLSIILRLLHTRGALSRAELTKITQLNRSTIATITGELEAAHWVEASEPEPTKRKGRPSPVIATSTHHVAIAVTPEVDGITIAVVALGGRVLRSVHFALERTPSPQEAVNAISAVIAGMLPELNERHRVLGIGLAVPGLVSKDDGLVVLAPRLGWLDIPFAAMVEEATGLPVIAGNDADCGVSAEVAYGAAAGDLDVVYLNGGASGIGAGVTVGGLLLAGAGGFGGELGHTLVRSGGAPCRCGASGCLEAEVDLGQLLAAAPGVGANELENAILHREPGSELDTVVNAQADALAVALRNIVNIFNPSTVVLGGFLGSLWAGARERISGAVLATAMRGPAQQARIVASSLTRRDNLSLGAAGLVFEPLLADPTLLEDAADTASA
ncbi:ROK family protein [Galactobacter valiniphilus]|uniref:ROK family protein n=1 Tax=Galactobacter valiniphilus TaxID=2676122 RepID=UPI003734FD9B